MRLADVSETVRAAASEPLVRAVELPPSSVGSLPEASGAAASTQVSQPAPATRLADIAKVISETPQPVPAPAVVITTPPPAPQPKVETMVPPAPKPKVEIALAAVPPAPKPKVETARSASVTPGFGAEEDSRVWVQIAGGADERAFPGEWKRLKGKAPELLSSQTPWTTPLKATNRLLVGPFENGRDAQEFVNKLGGKGITAFTWTSAQGQAIAKLATR